MVVRGGYGIYFDRPSGSFKSDLQLSAPFFIYQNVPAPPDMANPYPTLNINPFTIPLNVRVARDANGAPSWRRFDGTPFPATEPFSAKNFTFIDPFIQTPDTQQWSFNLQYEPSVVELGEFDLSRTADDVPPPLSAKSFGECRLYVEQDDGQYLEQRRCDGA
jgi:hypothetical protein